MSRNPKDDGISGCRTGADRVLAEERPQPADAFAADDMVGVDHVLDARDGRDVAADDDRRPGRCSRTRRHISRTLPTLTTMPEMPTMSYSRAVISSMKRSRVGKSSTRAGRRDVLLQEHQAPRAVEHAQRKRPLLASDLVVVQLRRIDRPRSKLVVHGEWLEDRGQKNARHPRIMDRSGTRSTVRQNSYILPDIRRRPIRPATDGSVCGTRRPRGVSVRPPRS